MSYAPTEEQQAIIDAYRPGSDLVIEAGAGTGKTSTLKMLAATEPGRRAVYVAYNKAIATDAARSFPRNVLCKTAHSLAFGAVGRRYAHRLRTSRVPIRVTAEILGIRSPIALPSGRMLAPHQIARLAMHSVTRFCYSAEPELRARHVPTPPGVDTHADAAAVMAGVLPYARRAWADIASVEGKLRFTHDCYLKLWQLSGPRLDTDVVLLDEAQDANPAVAAIVEGQEHAQRIMVGDRCQSIYGWRGATDAMGTFDADKRLVLSQSFRFGPAVAREANKWLSLLAAPLRLTGFDQIDSTVGPVGQPDAILCRSNAEAVKQVLATLEESRTAALVGGGDDIRRLAQAAIRLKAGQPTDHPELYAFSNWQEVQDYIEQDAAGQDLKVAVNLIDEHGPEALIAVLEKLVDEDAADVVISTAHKAKGREWAAVRVAEDFREPKISEDNPDPDIAREDAMLAYVTVTRARLRLDRLGLAWVDRWV